MGFSSIFNIMRCCACKYFSSWHLRLHQLFSGYSRILIWRKRYLLFTNNVCPVFAFKIVQLILLFLFFSKSFIRLKYKFPPISSDRFYYYLIMPYIFTTITLFKTHRKYFSSVKNSRLVWLTFWFTYVLNICVLICI